MTPRGQGAGLLAQLFPDSLFFFSKHFCELLVWKRSWPVGNALMYGENEAELGSRWLQKTRLRNSVSPELEDLKATRESKTLWTRVWAWVWEGPKSSAFSPPYPLPDNVCLKEEVVYLGPVWMETLPFWVSIIIGQAFPASFLLNYSHAGSEIATWKGTAEVPGNQDLWQESNGCA